MVTIFLVAAGGALGAVLRWFASQAVLSLGLQGSWATLSVNIVGGLLMGLLVGVSPDPSSPWRAFAAVGILGGFTTFSAFSLETIIMIERQEWGAAAVYVLASLALSVGACGLGLVMSKGVV